MPAHDGVEAGRDKLLNDLPLFVALQDFDLKKAAYAAEIAKSASGTSPTAQFNAAAAAYTAAKTYTEQLADQLFPPEVPEEIQASSMTVTAVSSGPAAEEVQRAEKKPPPQPVPKKNPPPQ